MTVKYARPSVSDLAFQVFGRSVHPELFTVYDSRTFVTDGYVADVRICEAGHVASFRVGDGTVTEVAATRGQPLPRNLRSFSQRLSGSRTRSLRFDSGIRYEVSYHIERLEPELFLNVHQELLMDLGRVELAHRFPSGNRFAPDPLSLIRADAQADGLLLHSYHTFPENCAVLKSQSLFELA
jgi:Protein of unknown function DUF2617